MRPISSACYFSLSLLLVSACGDNLRVEADATPPAVDAALPPDAPGPDATLPDAAPPLPDASVGSLACAGQDLPAPEGPTTTITGRVVTPAEGSLLGVPSAAVHAYRVGTTTSPVDSALTRTDGTYTLFMQNGGAPLDLYLRASNDEFLSTYHYPARAFHQSQVDVVVPMLTGLQHSMLAAEVGVTPAPENGTVLVTAVDCTGESFGGVTVSTSPADAQIFYSVNGTLDAAATATDWTGAAAIFNVAPGSIVIDAERDGTSLHELTVDVVAGALTIVTIQP